jgi:hypothetical protein
MRWHAPLDPNCPEVQEYNEMTSDDPIMAMSGCADEFYEAFEHRHRVKCARCQEYGVANIEVE